ncbi:isopeptide-forming domain-containing fimbrial protein [Pseudomaricurvus sp. HS19]|uniref:isopeptide-forming domain-containing fimbrial protein n=1 Tax=Pseudomaricurvus sp. HS19 TaxID=2692626 RepID=UPI00136D4E57|nr:isopeptide-forming domain-containing fimbrial protein [Pseudomaricurvus sp. HS19]
MNFKQTKVERSAPLAPRNHSGWLRGFVILLLLGMAGAAQAAQYDACSADWPVDPDRPGARLIDGENLPSDLTNFGQLAMDAPCTIRNFTPDNPFEWNISYPDTAEGSLIIFDNVYSTGNMSCGNNLDFVALWAVNGTEFANVGANCQDFFIPVEKIDKQIPAATARVGVPFTYTLRIPIMFVPGFSQYCVENPTAESCQAVGDPSQGSPNPLGNIHVWDDLTAAATGAEMTLLDVTVEDALGNPVAVLADNSTSKFLDILLPNTAANEQLFVQVEVVLDDDPANVAGTVFVNTAEWEFSRQIDTTGDGNPDTFFNPLPGEAGIAPPMVIVAPNLVMTKSTATPSVGLETITYTLDVQNVGGGEAWNVTVVDQLPEDTSDGSGYGFCGADPSGSVQAEVRDAGGSLVRSLTAVTDYTLNWNDSTGNPATTCQLSLEMTDAGGSLQPNEHLVITFDTQLDYDILTDPLPLPTGDLDNIAAATNWYNADSSVTGRIEITRNLTTGTPGTTDHEDNEVVTVALSGFYFEKTVENVNTGAYPAVTAVPGEQLHYTIRLFNVDETITSIVITDTLPGGQFATLPTTASRCEIVGVAPTVLPECTFSGGLLTVQGQGGVPLELPVMHDLIVEFDATLASGLLNGDTVVNQATLTASGISVPGPYLSDDPFVNGVAQPDVTGDEDETVVTIVVPSDLVKENPATTNVVVGEIFDYTITIPSASVAATLYDVRIYDTLPANLEFISASAQVGATNYTLVDLGAGADNDLELVETTNALDIPAGETAAVTLTVRVRNDATLNYEGAPGFTNTAYYTYARSNGGTQLTTSPDTTDPMTVVEPLLAGIKTVSNVSAPGAPAVIGNVLEYVVTWENSSNTVTAFDVNITDFLPAEFSLDTSFTPTLTINTVQPAGFVASPLEPGDGSLIWGRINGDESLDVPANGELVLTYRVVVNTASASPSVNSVYADWTSLDGVVTGERSGAGCPTFSDPDDYCSGPVSESVTTQDNTSLAKLVFDDSYAETPASTGNAVVRVGDTVTYDLVLNLEESTTSNVVVTDQLPPGMEYVSYTIETGGTAFVYAPEAFNLQAGATNADPDVLTWTFTDITNPVNDGVTDPLTIRYVARVVIAPATVGIDTSTPQSLQNSASVTYTGYDPANPALTATATIDVLQPQMSAITKVDDLAASRTGTGTNADPYQVNIVSDVMSFRLQSCNVGGAPAYGVILTDLLASELDETDLTTTPPVVAIGPSGSEAALDPADYTLTPAPRGGTMQFELLDTAPVPAGECVTITYDIGFHSDLTTQSTWSNQATLTQYLSLPLSETGRSYTPTDIAQVWMTNLVTVEPLAKAQTTGPEATVGEVVSYQITVPATPVNVALDSVVVTDQLDDALQYVSASAVDSGTNPVTLGETISGQNVSLAIASIPAGEQVTITLTTLVANNSFATAGHVVANTAAYTYTGMTDPTQTQATAADTVTIVEPELVIAKSVAPMTAPNAGDILTYTVTFTASGGVAADNFSDAFDLQVDDSLSLGLEYVAGSSAVDVGSVTDPAIIGDGVSTAQTLTWSLGDGSADIDVAEGTVVTLTYQVRVLDSVQAGQSLTNSAVVQWTGLDGVSADERTGTQSPAVNDYVDGPATAPPLTTLDNTTLTKTRLSDTFGSGDVNVRVGDMVEYELRIHLDEGQHTNLVLEDVLQQGLQFDGVVSINGVTSGPSYAAAAPFSHSPINTPVTSGDPATGDSTVTWTLGDITNVGDNNPANDEFVIVYRAQVMNNDVHPQVNSITLDNSATLTYDTATVPGSQSDSESITLLQPSLSVTKTAAPANGDTLIEAGEAITFTVDVVNSGTAPAFDTVVDDVLPVGMRQGGVTTTSMTLVNAGTSLPLLAPSYDSSTGIASWNLDSGAADAYTIPAGETLRLVYTVNADNNLGPGLTLENAVTATLYYSFDDEAIPAGAVASEREEYGPSITARLPLNSLTPGAPLKQNPADPTVTIGQEFTYTITIPQDPAATALHDVVITDDLSGLGVDVTFVGAVKLSGSQTWTPVNTGSGSTLVIEDTSSGIEIPAGEQIQVGITLRLDNTTGNSIGQTFTNTASYSYNQIDSDPVSVIDGGSSTTGVMTVIEPDISVIKTATPLSTPVVGGSLIEYSVRIDNSGTSTAYDINVVDTLPPELAFFSGFTPTATIISGAGSSPVSFTSTPAGAPAGPLVWGRDNGDGTLDLPAGSQLVITYQAQVLVSTNATLVNSVAVDWTSLDNSSSFERTGAGCPTTTAPNDYCAGDTASITVADSNSLTKSVLSDSYVDSLSTAVDATVRVGDTVTYQLAINLAEGSTDNVTVTDVLPSGMEFDSLVGITQSAGGNFSYSGPTGPGAGATGTLTWDFGDITNTASNDGTQIDTLTIEYRARVLPNAGIPHTPTTTLTNTATLAYTDGSGSPVVDPTRLESEATITLWQPLMDSLSKTDRLGRTGTMGTPLNVDVTSDVMQFRLQSCNSTGLAPAYSVLLNDDLPPQLDEGSMTAPVVRLDGNVLPGADYVYTPPAGRDGSLSVLLNVPVNPGQCVTVDYNIGFYTDFGLNQVWSNNVTLDEYWSLPATSGQQYAALGPVGFYMTNQYTVTPLTKSLITPAEATIGDDVIYEITLPASAVNGQLDNVWVNGTLNNALEFVSATAVDSGSNTVTLTNNTSGQDVILGVGSIPAGEQVTITLTTRVANNTDANAGNSFTNSASYTFDGMPAGAVTGGQSGLLTIIEPELVVAKSVVNNSSPGVAPAPGDILQYSVTVTASGGAAGDNFADAFDLLFNDSLSLGQVYIAGSSSISAGSVNEPLVNGDGSSVAQTLLWSLAYGSDIDVAEGTAVTLQYQTRVEVSAQPGQTLTNDVYVEWTSQNEDNSSPFERNGSDCPNEPNDYCTTASSSIITQLAVTYGKSVINDTTGQNPGDNASPGDTLRYTISIANDSLIPVTGVSLIDELDAYFVPGTLVIDSVSVSSYTDASVANGGANGTGLVSLSGITLAPQGDASGEDVLTVVFTAQLAAVIDSGTTVLNTALLSADNLAQTATNTTSTLIDSAADLVVEKISEDLTGDPADLQPGDTLRYTITVRNTGTENATNVTLRDLVPTYTTYVAGTTTLNGVAVADVSAGVSPLRDGMQINTPADATAGLVPADSTGNASYTATITFDVTVNAGVLDGTVISNQGFVNGAGSSGSTITETPSDDPSTTTADDPTVDVVGDSPLLDALKTVAITQDINGNGQADPGDRLQYTIVVSNSGNVDASGVSLQDDVPANSNYVANTVTLNGTGVGQPDGGVSPLVAGITIQSGGAAAGVIAAGASATVTFDVTVAGTAVPGDLIRNQGVVSSDSQNDEPTDADGIDSNGDQPTDIVVGNAQLLTVIEEVFDINGGVIMPGDTLEFVVTVTNSANTDATDVQLVSNMDLPVVGDLIYVTGSGRLDGNTAGVSVSGTTITGQYGATYGALGSGQTTVLRFQAVIDTNLTSGTTLTNITDLSWNVGTQTDQASASVVIGAAPGTNATLGGTVWRDMDDNQQADANETLLAGWDVALYRNTTLVATTQTDGSGQYAFVAVPPNDASSATYSVRFTAPAAGANTAKLGVADSPFDDQLQAINLIVVAGNDVLTNLNLPVVPNGVIYDAVSRLPVSGAIVRMLDAGSLQALPGSCFDDSVQQGQVVAGEGFYRFDINFSDPACPTTNTYLLEVTPPSSTYESGVSQLIAPANDATSAAFDVPSCLGSGNDAVSSTPAICEVVALATAPPTSVGSGTAGTTYYLHLALDNVLVPGQNQLFNNHIPLDPVLDNAVAVRKVAGKVTVSRGDLVPYTIIVNNSYLSALQDLTLVDTFPPGFKYVEGSARLNGVKTEPALIGGQLRWDGISLSASGESRLELLFIPGAGVVEGEYINRAHIESTISGQALSNTASAAVRVVPDPTLDCSDIYGKVFDDVNFNGYPDAGERGIPNARVVSARGLLITADEHGRFHLTCAAIPDELRGSNFILKLDERSLPSGYRVTSENPRVIRLTRGKAAKFNFGATMHRVVRLDVAAGVFEPDSTEIRMQWLPRLQLLIAELQKAPSVLRVSYLADVESERLVKKRVAVLKELINDQWQEIDCCYVLDVETEIYWRRGSPPDKSGVIK